jgi:Fe-S cluster assembly ATPase SufC
VLANGFRFTILEIKDLQVSINEMKKNLNLKVNRGEIHAIINGSGKYFSKVLAGHQHSISNGDIFFKG